MYEWDDILTLPLSCLHSLNVDVRLSNEFRDRNNLVEEMSVSDGTRTRVPKLPTIQQADRAEDKTSTSAQRNYSLTTHVVDFILVRVVHALVLGGSGDCGRVRSIFVCGRFHCGSVLRSCVSDTSLISAQFLFVFPERTMAPKSL
jgi:hypothetical protein